MKNLSDFYLFYITLNSVPWSLRQWLIGLEYLLCMHMDMSLNPWTQTEASVTMWACDPSTKGWRQADPGISLASKAS